jgi:hypothetical protein
LRVTDLNLQALHCLPPATVGTRTLWIEKFEQNMSPPRCEGLYTGHSEARELEAVLGIYHFGRTDLAALADAE